MRYAKPKSIDEALALLSEDRWRILAGGTDFYPAQGNQPYRDNILDINALDELRLIQETETHFVLGARASWSDVIRRELPAAFDMLKLAAREVGSIQIQNAGTIGGNLCNASPAADGAPPLLALDAEVELRAANATRMLPLREFILGNRRTAFEPGEMLVSIRVSKADATGMSHFVKLGARRYLVISIAMAAARLTVDSQGIVEDAAISVGACSAVAARMTGLEEILRGQAADAGLCECIAGYPFPELAPIDDVRGTADYRHGAAREIVGRTVAGVLASIEAAGAAQGSVAA